ncbi:MAG: hypothetical protein F6J87_25715 [Spirulina sp. SIO3F2]|nr:hypothetical protein [Spirulina sp. SIO3F2]
MTPLVAYLAGFALIQLGIAIGVYKLATVLLAGHQTAEQPRLPLRFAGFTLSGIGFAFLSGAILG